VERARGTDPRREERDFNPLGTIQRWSEEGKIMYGKHASDRLSKLADHIVLRMLPASLQAAREAREKEAAKLAELQAEAEVKAQAAKKEEEEAAATSVTETPAPAPEPPAPVHTDTDEEMAEEPTLNPNNLQSRLPVKSLPPAHRRLLLVHRPPPLCTLL
jgi:E3 ubiquitin-protein ligase HUWE1